MTTNTLEAHEYREYVPHGYDADLLALTRLSDTGKHAVRAVMAVALGEGGEG